MEHDAARVTTASQPRVNVEALAASCIDDLVTRFQAQIRPMGVDMAHADAWRAWLSSGLSIKAWRSRQHMPQVHMVPDMSVALEPDRARKMVAPWIWCLAFGNEIKQRHDAAHYAKNQYGAMHKAIEAGDVATAHGCVGLRSSWVEQRVDGDGAIWAKIRPGHASCPDGTPEMRIIDQHGQLQRPAHVFDAGGRVAVDDGHPDRIAVGIPLADGPYRHRTGMVASDAHVRPGDMEHTVQIRCLVAWDDEPGQRSPLAIQGVPDDLPVSMISRGVRIVALGAEAMDVVRHGSATGAHPVFIAHEIVTA